MRVLLARNAFSKLLLRRHISCEELSKGTGYSLASVRAWRCGARTPSIGARTLIAQVINGHPSSQQWKPLTASDIKQLLRLE